MGQKITEFEELTSVSESTDFLLIVDSSDTSEDTSGTTKKVKPEKIGDGLTSVGGKDIPGGDIVGTSDTQTLTNKTLSSGVIESGVNVVEVLKKVYPVGSVYINAGVSTNPADLLGFGTWVSYGAGRVIVGLDATQTEFDLLGKTGGAKTHTLTTDEIPAHNHTVIDPGHTHSITNVYSAGGAGSDNFSVAGPVQNKTARTSGSSTTGVSIGNTGLGGGHNNLQPYIVAYLWRRTV